MAVLQEKQDEKIISLFVVGSTGEKNGLPQENYMVAIFGAMVSSDDQKPSYSPIDPKYGSPQSTDLTYEATSSTKSYEIKVPRNPEKPPKWALDRMQ